MNKFRRLRITLATALCLIGGNKASNSTVNAETPKSIQVENKVSENSKRKDVKDEDLVDPGVALAIIVCVFIATLYLKQSLGLGKKDEYPHGEIDFEVVNGIPVYHN